MSSNRTLLTNYLMGVKAPRNFCLNPNAKFNLNDITDADSIVTRDTNILNVLDDEASFAIDADASGELAAFLASPFTNGVLGQTCEAQMDYMGDASLYKAYVTIGGTQVSDEIQLLNVSVGSQQISLIFPCGTSLINQPALVIEATDNAAAAFNLGNIYIGKAVSLGTVAQGEVVVSALRASSNQDIGSTSPTTVIFNQEDQDVYGEYDNTTGIFTAKRAGNLLVSTNTRWGSFTASDSNSAIVVKNGSNVCSGLLSSSTIQTTVVVPSCSVPIEIGDEVYIQVDSSTDSAYNIIAASSTYLTITYYPTSSQIVQTANLTDLSGFTKSPEAANCFWTFNGASFAGASANASCSASLTESGNLYAPATKIPATRARNILPGRYLMIASGLIGGRASSSGTQTCNWEIHDGTNSGGETTTVTQVNTGTSYVSAIYGLFEYTSKQTDIQFQIRGKRAGGNNDCAVENTGQDLTFTLIPLSQAVPKPFIPSSVFFDDEVKAGGELGVNTIYTGTYSPTVADPSGTLDSQSLDGVAKYTRIGNRVRVSLFALINPTSTGGVNSTMSITLPHEPTVNFTVATEVIGVGAQAGAGTSNQSGYVTAIIGTKTALYSFNSQDGNARTHAITFEYDIE